MKKILFILTILFTLSACCTEEEIEDCANRNNGLSKDTCIYLLCR